MRTNEMIIYALQRKQVLLKQYNIGVSCGFGSELFDVSKSYFDFAQYCGTSPDDTFLVRVEGDSMSPEIKDGDLMVVDHGSTPQEGDIVLAFIDKEDVLAKYYSRDEQANTITLSSHNPAFSPVCIDLNYHEVDCFGVVRHVLHHVGKRREVHLMQILRTSELLAQDEKKMQGACPKEPMQSGSIAAAQGNGAFVPAAQEIDVKGLEAWFKASFKGAGGRQDYFNCCLVEDLKKQWSDRQLAIIANMIYEGKCLAGKPESFVAWYKDFCRLTKRRYHSGYRPCKLSPSRSMQRRFYYLDGGV